MCPLRMEETERVQFRIWVLISSEMDGIDFPLVFRGAWLERSDF